jgi:broad specificity phosphatase PhoE
MFKRSRELKKRLQTIISEYAKPHSQRREILIIGHSCVLKYLLGKELG